MRSFWVHKAAAALALAAGLAAGPLRSAEADGPLRLVRVTGGSYRDAREAARLAEDILHRIDALTGRVRTAPVKPMARIALPESAWGAPAIALSVPDAGLPWEIRVTGDFHDSYGDLAACLVRLDLSLRSGSGGESVPRLDWLAVGMAENLFATRKARNREWVAALAEEGRLPSLERIATWVRIPDGPMLEKAVCGRAVGWMLETGGTNLLARILERVELRQPVTADWLTDVLADGAPEHPEDGWRAAAARRDVLAGGARPVSPILFRQFRAALGTPVSELSGGAADAASDPLSPYQLLALRGEPGAKEAARARSLDAAKFAIGTPAEFRDMTLLYKAFFDGLAGRTPAFWLRRRLRAADRALRGLEDLTLARSAWLDELDGEGASIELDRAGVFGRSALERFVDEAEARLEADGARPAEE